MSIVRFFEDNLIDAAGVAITASSQAAELPPANVAHQHRTKVYRSGNAPLNPHYLNFDLLAAKTARACVILDHTLPNNGSLRLQASNDAGFAALTVDVVLPWAAGVIAYKQALPFTASRYWRIKWNNTGAADVGRVFIGDYLELEEDPDFGGLETRPEDLTKGQRADSGQLYFDVRPILFSHRFDFSNVPNTMKAALEAAFVRLGIHRSFFIQVDGVFDAPLYVNFDSPPSFKNTAFDGGLLWDTRVSIEEQL